MMVSALRTPSHAIPLEPLDLEIRFSNGKICSYPKSVLLGIGVAHPIESLDSTPELFELLINLKKKCLHEVAGSWLFETPSFYENLHSLIKQLYRDKADHPFTFLDTELSSLTLEQADTILRFFENNTKMEERRERDTIVRFCAEEIPFLVKIAKMTYARRHLGAQFFILRTSLHHNLIRCQRRLERKKVKSLISSGYQKTRLEETALKLSMRIYELKQQIERLDNSGYPDLSKNDKEARVSPIKVKFGHNSVFTYPPQLRKHLHQCQFSSSDKPVELAYSLSEREHFESYLKRIEGIPLRKQYGNALCNDPSLYEKLTAASRSFIAKLNREIAEELRYITLEEAKEIASKNQSTYLSHVAKEILLYAKYFASESDASRFFKERADLFDERERLKRKLDNNKSAENNALFESVNDKLALIESRLKCLPLSIQGLQHYAQNAPEKMEEPLAKIEAYKKEIFSILSIPEHLKPFVFLFDYYGYVVRRIDNKAVISFCGIHDFELDFEFVSGHEFETVLRKQIDFIFPGAGDPIFKSLYSPKTKEEKIKANPNLYRNIPRLIMQNEVTISIPNKVILSRAAFQSGKPSHEDFQVLIEVNNWQRFGFSPYEIHFIKESVTEDWHWQCVIRKELFNINPTTLRASLNEMNRIRSEKYLENKFLK